MITMTLVRSSTMSNSVSTVGRLIVPGYNQDIYTIEQPWRDNAVGASCVPSGVYQLRPDNSVKFGRCYALINLMNDLSQWPMSGVKRSRILIHPANVASQLQGCIAPGLRRGKMSYHGQVEQAVFDSRRAFNLLMGIFNGEEHRLKIGWD